MRTRGKRPTLKQWKIIGAALKTSDDGWLVVKNLPGALHIVHRITGVTKVLHY